MVTHSLPSSPTLEQTETWQHKHVCSHCFSLFKQVIYVVINTTSQDINIYSFSDKNSILIQKKKLFDMLLLNLHFLMLFLVKISDKEKSSSSNIMREIMRKILMIIRLDWKIYYVITSSCWILKLLWYFPLNQSDSKKWVITKSCTEKNSQIWQNFSQLNYPSCWIYSVQCADILVL